MSTKEYREQIEQWVKKDPNLTPPQILKRLNEMGANIKRPILYHHLGRWGIFKSNRFVWEEYEDIIISTLKTTPNISLKDLARTIFKGKPQPFHFNQLAVHLQKHGVEYLWKPHSPTKLSDIREDLQKMVDENPNIMAADAVQAVAQKGHRVKEGTMRTWLRQLRGPKYEYTHNVLEDNKNIVTRVYNKNPTASLEVLRLILKSKGVQTSTITLMRKLHEWGLRPSTSSYQRKTK